MERKQNSTGTQPEDRQTDKVNVIFLHTIKVEKKNSEDQKGDKE